MLWSDMTFENEASHPFGTKRPSDVNQFNQDLFDYYAKCTRLRRSSEALTHGDFQVMATSDTHDFLAFSRSYKKSHAIVVINNSNSDQRVSIPMRDDLARMRWSNSYDDTKFHIAKGMLSVVLRAKTGIVLRAKAK